jgi:hypothetical protein
LMVNAGNSRLWLFIAYLQILDCSPLILAQA